MTLKQRPLNAPQAAMLRRALRPLASGQAKKAFKLIRAHDDAALLAALAPPRAKRKQAPSLARDLAAALRPILGPAQEKADLLVAHMAGKHGRALDFAPAGLADAARRLRAHFSEAQIRAAAKSLLKELTAAHGDRETVV